MATAVRAVDCPSEAVLEHARGGPAHHSPVRAGRGVTTVAVVPMTGSPMLAQFGRDLAASLAAHGPALHLSGASADRYEEDGPASPHRYVICEADATLTPWTRRCLQRADRVLLVCPAGADPTSAALPCAAPALGAAAPRELVLVHPAGGTAPAGTGRWLAHEPGVRHHHVRLHARRDMDRLARSLAGRAVGLVLGGGGARAFAHIGVIRALEEAGIPIDYIGGSSIGAVMAAQYAIGWDCETMLRRNKELVRRSLLDYTLPFVSLLAGRRFSSALAEMFGETQIEDLWRGYFCVSSNLTTAEVVMHRAGSLRRALRASCALPGVLPPLLEDGELLVDGMVLNNLPVDLMRRFCDGGPIVAVDVMMDFDLDNAYSFGESISARQLLWNRINPFARSKLVVPSVLRVLLQAAELHNIRWTRSQMARADLPIRPAVGSFGTFAVQHFERLVELGYEEARTMFAESGCVRLQGRSGHA